jgi:chlorobactene glucosyltransferase
MNLILWFWLGVTAIAFLVWSSRHMQLSRARRLMPPLHPGMYRSPDGPLPSISMLVAAKDEEDNIETCLRSLIRQDYPNLRIITINDRSTDRTGEIIDHLARESDRLTAVHVRELRQGWFGKNNAMREGMARADGEWLCFTDADCEYTSDRTLAIAMRYAEEKKADFVSVLPTHQTNTFWERVIQPACSGILMIWFNPMKVNDPRSATAYANGAFMLMRRSCYEAIGGHEPVKTELNEDIHMARLAKVARQRLVVVSNEGLYTVRMYASLRQMWAGWSRIFYGCFGTLRRLLVSTVVITTFSLLPWISLIAAGLVVLLAPAPGGLWRALLPAAAATCVAQLSIMMRFYALNHSSPCYGLFYPIGAAVGLGALVNAIRRVGGREKVTWRGTTYRGSHVTSSGSTPS